MPTFPYTPKTWATGEQIRASDLNTYLAVPLALLAPSSVKVTTTDATVTTLISVGVDMNSEIMLYGALIAARDDHSAALHARFAATFRRGAGDVVPAGSTFTVYEDSAGAPTMSWTISAPHLALLRVTGIAAQTWDWKAIYMKGTL